MLAKHHIQERVEGPVVSAQLSGLCPVGGLCGGAVGCFGCPAAAVVRDLAQLVSLLHHAAAQPEISLPAAGEALHAGFVGAGCTLSRRAPKCLF